MLVLLMERRVARHTVELERVSVRRAQEDDALGAYDAAFEKLFLPACKMTLLC